MEADTAAKIASGAISKGDVLAVAGRSIQAAKQTPNLLPLCHPLVGSVYVNFRIEDAHVVRPRSHGRPDRGGDGPSPVRWPRDDLRHASRSTGA